MDKEFINKISKFLRDNTGLSKEECEVASNFLIGLTLVDKKKKVAVLNVMLTAVQVIEKITSGELNVEDFDKVLN